jgi:hypothetical protein
MIVCVTPMRELGINADWALTPVGYGLGANPFTIGRFSRPRSGSGRLPRVPLRSTLGYQNPRFHRYKHRSAINGILSPCLHVSMSPCLHVSMSPCLHVSMSPCLHVSLSPCLLVSMSPCLLVSMSPCLLVSHLAPSLSVLGCVDFSPTQPTSHPRWTFGNYGRFLDDGVSNRRQKPACPSLGPVTSSSRTTFSRFSLPNA